MSPSRPAAVILRGSPTSGYSSAYLACYAAATGGLIGGPGGGIFTYYVLLPIPPTGDLTGKTIFGDAAGTSPIAGSGNSGANFMVVRFGGTGPWMTIQVNISGVVTSWAYC
jgi:hypothetical protein